MRTLAHFGFAAGLAGLGLLSLLYGDFAMNWQPVPAGLPFRPFLAYLSGTLLFAGGLCMLIRVTALNALLALTSFVFSWLLLLQVPRVIASPVDIGVWLGFGETLLLVAGGWVLCILTADDRQSENRNWLFSAAARRVARIAYAIALPIIGLSHFKYVDATASMVPTWLPARHGFAYLTGAGHVAAGIALVFGIVPRLAATMEAAMITAFVLLLHVPGVVGEPRSRLQWTMLCIATAYASAAWAIAASYFTSERPGMSAATLSSEQDNLMSR